MQHNNSHSLFNKAKTIIPGGVNSPVRAFNGVGGNPVFFEKAKGAHIYDVDGNQYIDYVSSWGPMILGHNHPEVIKAVQQAVNNGLSFGASTENEVLLAEKICQLVPSIEKVRLTCSGTEATMSAIRLARAYTKREIIIKFEGCYHGHGDSFLIKAGSGALTLNEPSSPGVPKALAELTINLTYNDINSVNQFMQNHGHNIACIIVEPVAGNMNCILPKTGFLEGLRSLCDEYGSLLIFDEVMTGFRVALGGAQEYFDVMPDLTTIGKVVGGGMPIGAFGGKTEIMDYIAPCGPVYQAGTLSGNPISTAAGLATLKLISQPGFFEKLTHKTAMLTKGILEISKSNNIAITANQIGGMFGLFFSHEEKVEYYQQAVNCNQKQFQTFFHALLENGIYIAPSAFEAGFVSDAHSDQDLAKTLEVVEKTLMRLK